MKVVKGWHFPDNDGLLSKQVKGHYPDTRYQQEALEKAYEQIRQVSSFDMAIDVGANVGLHSIRFSTKFKNVISFEPSSSNFECLKVNVQGYDNIKTFKSALGKEEGELELRLPSSSNNYGAFSFKDFAKSKEDLLKELVPVVKLDEFMLAPSFIKIDTQGFEVEVVTGGIETIKKHRPVILAEADRKQVQQLHNLLAPIGYKLTWFGSKDKVFSPVHLR